MGQNGVLVMIQPTPRDNPEMDKMAQEYGLGHWKCVSAKSNAWWRRDDGVEVEPFAVNQDKGWPEYLREFDQRFPME